MTPVLDWETPRDLAVEEDKKVALSGRREPGRVGAHHLQKRSRHHASDEMTITDKSQQERKIIMFGGLSFSADSFKVVKSKATRHQEKCLQCASQGSGTPCSSCGGQMHERVTEDDFVDSILVEPSSRKISEGKASAVKIYNFHYIKKQLVLLPIVSSEETSWRRGNHVR
jgi:hypothetical protein